LLDPFGLFNFAGMTNLAQGTPMGQVQATTAPFAQPQQGFAAAPVAQPLQPAQPTLQQMPPYYSQPQPQPQHQQQQQQFNYNQQPNPNLQQNVQPNVAAQQQAGLQQPTPVRNVYYPQNNNYQPQQLPRNQQQPSRTNQQPTPLYHTQHQQPRPHNQASPLPKQQPSPSIDAAPITVQKYVDGKGPAPSSVPQQCPRQPGWAPCITKQEANARFINCCARLGDGCLPLCNYDAPLATMQLAVLTGRCPLSKMADIMVCASGYEDATSCCEAYNVFEPGYEQCRPYCNPAAGLPQGGLLSEKYKCLVKLGHIQQCFYVSQKP
uniref:DB domain-containing protein n=1 Tax=Heligmosomoides polygyrus TaxID=6339 RepID=A0A183GNC5_HELPZ